MKHDNRLYTIELHDLEVPKCRKCGEVVFDDMADAQICIALRSHLQLLTPEQIRDALNQLEMTQKQLAETLGTAEATVSRWCSGAMIQSRSMDRFLRAFFGCPEMRDVLCGLGTESNPAEFTVR
jgi:predicted XRE-type DNA-binding protein